MTRIIYKQDNGRVAIIHPCTWETNPATGENFTVEEVAAMIVPNGKKFKIIETNNHLRLTINNGETSPTAALPAIVLNAQKIEVNVKRKWGFVKIFIKFLSF